MAQAQAGIYFVRPSDIVSTGVSKSPKTNNHYLFIEFKTEYIAGDNEWVALPEPLTRTLMFSFSDGAWEFTEKKLNHLGFDGNFENPSFTKLGEGVSVTCDFRPGQDGKPRENWDIQGWGQAERPDPDADVVARLKARWNQNKTAAAPPVGKPAAPPSVPPVKTPPPAATAEEEGEVPF